MPNNAKPTRRFFITGAQQLFLGLFFLLPSTAHASETRALCPPGFHQGNVIFFHPDGLGLNSWGALRLLQGNLNWDQLPGMSVYVGTMLDNLVGTSHGGATTHAYGKKVPADSFGMAGTHPLTGASGFAGSLAIEAKAKGYAVALLQSGSITEPGTAVFMASSRARDNHADIARQVIESDADIIMSGGEAWLLPAGTTGRFGPGKRKDGRNLITDARARGYSVIFSASELSALPAETQKVLGVFAHEHSFHDAAEEDVQEKKLPLYEPQAPTISQMIEKTLAIFKIQNRPFLIIAEEEGTDNFGNMNNAAGVLEAARRADDAIGVIRQYIAQNPKTLLLMAADSEAGGLVVDTSSVATMATTPEHSNNGAPRDGQNGTRSAPFRGHNGLPFSISWATRADTAGGILARADGLNSRLIPTRVDNTDIYRILGCTLFGEHWGARERGSEW